MGFDVKQLWTSPISYTLFELTGEIACDCEQICRFYDKKKKRFSTKKVNVLNNIYFCIAIIELWIQLLNLHDLKLFL